MGLVVCCKLCCKVQARTAQSLPSGRRRCVALRPRMLPTSTCWLLAPWDPQRGCELGRHVSILEARVNEHKVMVASSLVAPPIALKRAMTSYWGQP